jgi:hypothetical protein
MNVKKFTESEITLRSVCVIERSRLVTCALIHLSECVGCERY